MHHAKKTLLQIPHARNLEKEFPAANTPIPCPVTMQVDRKNQALAVRCPHCRAQFNKPASQHLLVNSNVHVPGLEDQVEKLLLHNHFSRACVAFDQQKQEITFCAEKKVWLLYTCERGCENVSPEMGGVQKHHLGLLHCGSPESPLTSWLSWLGMQLSC